MRMNGSFSQSQRHYISITNNNSRSISSISNINNNTTTIKIPVHHPVVQLKLDVAQCVHAIATSITMEYFVRLWWYCAMAMLWWLVFVIPINADAMVDPLKIFWVLTNSSYLGMYTEENLSEHEVINVWELCTAHTNSMKHVICVPLSAFSSHIWRKFPEMMMEQF